MYYCINFLKMLYVFYIQFNAYGEKKIHWKYTCMFMLTGHKCENIYQIINSQLDNYVSAKNMYGVTYMDSLYLRYFSIL